MSAVGLFMNHMAVNLTLKFACGCCLANLKHSVRPMDALAFLPEELPAPLRVFVYTLVIAHMAALVRARVPAGARRWRHPLVD